MAATVAPRDRREQGKHKASRVAGAIISVESSDSIVVEEFRPIALANLPA